MPERRYNSRGVLIAGYIVFALGIGNTVADFVSRIEFSFPLNIGIVIGNSAIMLIGLVSLIVGRCLKRLEERLDELEQLRTER